MSPDRFLSTVAQLGLMDDLADCVLRQAVAGWAELRDRGHDLRMCVNTTASDLAGWRFADTFERLVVEYSVPPGAVLIEVTEDDVTVDRERSRVTFASFLQGS